MTVADHPAIQQRRAANVRCRPGMLDAEDLASRILQDVGHLDGDLVVYGGQATGHATPRSDIDIALVAHDADRAANRRRWQRALAAAPPGYDVRVYELLPLPLQMPVVDGRVIRGDPVALSAYFYPARRAWKDIGPRIRANPPNHAAHRRRIQDARARAVAGANT